jgi:hypothetical protein
VFKVKAKLPDFNMTDLDSRTQHFNNERLKRYHRYESLIKDTTFSEFFVVDGGHKNGCEVHCLNDKGICFIYNKNSRKLITVLALRPQQYKRYYQRVGIPHNKKIAGLCLQHTLNNLNQI